MGTHLNGVILQMTATLGIRKLELHHLAAHVRAFESLVFFIITA